MSEPVRLKVFVEELDDENEAQEYSDIDIAVIIDDVMNHKPKFLQQK